MLQLLQLDLKTLPNTGLPERQPEKTMLNLADNHHPTMITQPIVSPIESTKSDVEEINQELSEEEEPFVVKKFNLEEEVSEITEPISVNSTEIQVNDEVVEPSSDGKIRFYLEDDEVEKR